MIDYEPATGAYKPEVLRKNTGLAATFRHSSWPFILACNRHHLEIMEKHGTGTEEKRARWCRNHIERKKQERRDLAAHLWKIRKHLGAPMARVFLTAVRARKEAEDTNLTTAFLWKMGKRLGVQWDKWGQPILNGEQEARADRLVDAIVLRKVNQQIRKERARVRLRLKYAADRALRQAKAHLN